MTHAPERLASYAASPKTHDVIDASVVLCARARGHGVLTTDVADLRRLDPSLRVVAI